MSTLPRKYIAIAREIFELKKVNFLWFNSNMEFIDFVAKSTNIDMDSIARYKALPSKAKKLRAFIETENDQVVGKLMYDLLERRYEYWSRIYENDCIEDPQYENEIVLRNIAIKMKAGLATSLSTQDIFNNSLNQTKEILEVIKMACNRICVNSAFNESTCENILNDFVREILLAWKKFEVKDQSRHGFSSTGKQAGNIDILLTNNNTEYAIIEGVKLDFVNSSEITKHIDKVTINYNPLGTPSFLVVYYNGGNYSDFCKRFFQYLRNYEYKNPIISTEELMIDGIENAALRSASIILKKSDFSFPLYFVIINIRKEVT